jgi:hypothetical protein
VIDAEITFREKGYRSTDLSEESHKKVWAVCDDCGKGRWVIFQAYRDLCHKCASEKRRKYKYDKSEDIVRSIDEDKTYNEKGYRSTDLSIMSNKKVYAICVECGSGRWIPSSLYRDVCFKCIHKTDEHRKTLKENHADVSGKNNPNWQEGISFGEYCEKFNAKFKESIREKFGRKCFMCSTTEEDNGRKLCVHHVSYDKECMCNGVECEFVPLCMRCHAKTGYDKESWERLIINVLSYEGWIQ